LFNDKKEVSESQDNTKILYKQLEGSPNDEFQRLPLYLSMIRGRDRTSKPYADTLMALRTKYDFDLYKTYKFLSEEENTMRSRTILIVDDEPRSREGMRKILGVWAAGQYEILTASNGAAALQIVEETPVELMITDIRMPEISGLALVTQIREKRIQRQPSVILISGYAQFEYAQQAIHLSVMDYLLKPIGREKLIASVEDALKKGEEREHIVSMRKMADPQLMAIRDEEAVLSDPVRQAMHFVETHIEEAISLQEVAEHVHLNGSYFSSLFKEQCQMNFSEYVTRRKLQKSKEFLLKTNLPIVEIASRTGYQNVKYFNKLFKEYEGMSPGRYRSMRNGMEAHIQ
jgi:YesN/AraC family two-component response regulator